jgi:hypothetical protein
VYIWIEGGKNKVQSHQDFGKRGAVGGRIRCDKKENEKALPNTKSSVPITEIKQETGG